MFVALKNKMKKALIIAYNNLNNSGVPNVIYQTIKALHEQYSFDVLVFGDDDYYYQKLKNEDIDIRLIKYIDKKPKGKISRLFWWFCKMPHDHYVFMKKLLKENDYDVIHSFKEYYGWPFFKAAKKAGVNKRIYHCNINVNAHLKTNKFLIKRNIKLSIKYSTRLIGVSEMCCNNIFKDKDYSVLYNTYNECKFNDANRNNLLNDEFVITQVGSFSDNKNQIFSINVLIELIKLYKNCKLNLVGAEENNTYCKSVIDFVQKNNLDNRVVIMPKTENVNEIYKETTFVIIPSFSEGFSLVAIEAQACGINVFASTNVTKEVDCGGVKFLDLSKGPEFWAKEIYNRFMAVNNKREKFNLTKFSFNNFKNRLINIYEGE